MIGKKTVLKIAAVAALAVLTAAGGYYIGRKSLNDIQNAIPKETTNEKIITPSEGVKPDEPVTYITKSKFSAAAEGNKIVTDSYAGSLTGGGEDILRVYCDSDSAETQNWVVEIKTEDNEYYTLLNQGLSGRVYAEVGETKNGEKSITLILSTKYGTALRRYTYSESGFKEEVFDSRESEEILYSSLYALSEDSE